MLGVALRRAVSTISIVVVFGCADEDTTIAESPDPTELAQNHFADGCLIVRGDLRCFRATTATQPELSPEERVLLQRDEPLDGPPQSIVDLGGQPVTSVVGGGPFRCVSLANGEVKCWGFNRENSFPLGVPDPTAVIGDDTSERGAAMPAVDLGQGLKALQLASSLGMCARFDDGRVKCWGADPCEGCGRSGEVLGDAPGEMGDALPFVDLGSAALAAGLVGANGRTCIWTEDGRVKCWGLNDRGQLGLPVEREPFPSLTHLDPVGDDPGEMGDSLPFVDLGQDVRVIQVSTGTYHTCALTDAGRIKCWGANYSLSVEGEHPDPVIETKSHFGRLGLGDRDDRVAPLGDALPYVDLGADFFAVAMSAGDVLTCAVSSEMRLKCWGSEFFGGGPLDDVGDEPGEMGDALPFVDLGDGRTVAMIDHPHRVLLDDGEVRCSPARGLAGSEQCILPAYTGWIK